MEDLVGFVYEIDPENGEETGILRRIFDTPHWKSLLSWRRETQEPLVQDDTRLMYWTCIQDSGFPSRVNHAVATHRQVDMFVGSRMMSKDCMVLIGTPKTSKSTPIIHIHMLHIQ